MKLTVHPIRCVSHGLCNTKKNQNDPEMVAKLKKQLILTEKNKGIAKRRAQ